MKYVLSAILGALAFLVALLFGKRRLLDNGSGANRIGSDIDRSKDTVANITSGIVTAEKRVEIVENSVSTATDRIDQALGILDKVRQRTEANQNGDGSGTGGD